MYSIMVERNLKGRELEKLGNVEEAIVLYEANVKDRFDGNFPYERLKIIYGKQKKYSDALRVCKSFISVVDELLKLGSERGDLLPKRENFSQWIIELEKKINEHP